MCDTDIDNKPYWTKRIDKHTKKLAKDRERYKANLKKLDDTIRKESSSKL